MRMQVIPDGAFRTNWGFLLLPKRAHNAQLDRMEWRWLEFATWKEQKIGGWWETQTWMDKP